MNTNLYANRLVVAAPFADSMLYATFALNSGLWHKCQLGTDPAVREALGEALRRASLPWPLALAVQGHYDV